MEREFPRVIPKIGDLSQHIKRIQNKEGNFLIWFQVLIINRQQNIQEVNRLIQLKILSWVDQSRRKSFVRSKPLKIQIDIDHKASNIRKTVMIRVPNWTKLLLSMIISNCRWWRCWRISNSNKNLLSSYKIAVKQKIWSWK